jgi:hypothetical protein
VPPEPSPSVSIAVSATFIDLTAISINLAVSYDEEGVVLPRGIHKFSNKIDHKSMNTSLRHMDTSTNSTMA